jgi:hypothetical protein
VIALFPEMLVLVLCLELTEGFIERVKEKWCIGWCVDCRGRQSNYVPVNNGFYFKKYPLKFLRGDCNFYFRKYLFFFSFTMFPWSPIDCDIKHLIE